MDPVGSMNAPITPDKEFYIQNRFRASLNGTLKEKSADFDNVWMYELSYGPFLPSEGVPDSVGTMNAPITHDVLPL